jgi:hypothetical protein
MQANLRCTLQNWLQFGSNKLHSACVNGLQKDSQTSTFTNQSMHTKSAIIGLNGHRMSNKANCKITMSQIVLEFMLCLNLWNKSFH